MSSTETSELDRRSPTKPPQPDDMIDVAFGKPRSFWQEADAHGVKVDLMTVYPLQVLRLSGADVTSVAVSTDQTVWTELTLTPSDIDASYEAHPNETDADVLTKCRYLNITFANAPTPQFDVSLVLSQREVTDAEWERQNTPISDSEYTGDLLKTLILGTSNSLTRGYVDGLKSSGLDVQSNVSLGSSHISLTGYRLSELDDVDGQLLILDLHVVEQRAQFNGFDFKDLAAELLADVACWCAARNIVPVFLIMPARTPYTKGDFTHVNSYIDICKSLGIAWFDGYVFVEALAEKWGRTPLSFLRDESHMNRLSARCLSYVLGNCVRERLAPWLSDAAAPTGIATYEGPTFRHVDVDDVENVPTVERKTSLVTEQLARLTPGDHIEFDVPDGADVVGLALNMAQTNATLRIEGENTLIKRLDGRFYRPDKPLWLVSWALLQPVTAAQGRIRVTCVASTDLSDEIEYEDNDHRMGWDKFAQTETAVLELKSLILRLPGAPRPKRTLPEDVLDLSRDMDLSRLGHL